MSEINVVPQRRHLTPIVHLTEDCNLGCKYCYTGSAFLPLSKHVAINHKFNHSIPALLDWFRQVSAYNAGESTLLIFHGGEPLLIEASNWRRLLSEASKLEDCELRFGVQSNGTLVNEEFCKLFAEYKVQVGISLDGPPALHDLTRPNKGGGSSFDAVWRGIEKLQAAGIRFGVLVTLTSRNVEAMDELYEFFSSRKVKFSIRPIFGSAHTDVGDMRITPSDYARAFCQLFDIWFDDPNADFSLISEFSSMMAQFVEPIEGLVSCSFSKACADHFISFNLDGDLSPCNRFHGNADFVYGNLKTQTLDNLMASELPRKLSDRWRKLDKEECGKCEMQEFCYGGCPANNVTSGRDYFARDYYCDAYKAIHAHVVGRMRATLSPVAQQ